MKVNWLHAFSTEKKGGGNFVFQQVDFFRKIGVSVDLVPVHGLTHPFVLLKTIGKLRRKFESEILHAQYGSGTSLLTAYIRGKKRVLTLRGSDWYVLKSSSFLQYVRSFVGVLASRIAIRRFDDIIVVSNRMKKDIINRYPRSEGKLHVIPTGIDLERFVPIDKTEARRKLGVDQGDFRIGIGSIDDKNPVKRIHLAKKAVSLASQVESKIKLVVLSGIKPEDMNDHINTCNLILLCSTHEGWPNIIKEGLACNIPFVSTNVGDLAGIATKHNACFISDPDPAKLCNTILESYKLIKESPQINNDLRSEVLGFEIKKTVEEIKKIYGTNT